MKIQTSAAFPGRYVRTRIPETRGTSLEEIEQYWREHARVAGAAA